MDIRPKLLKRLKEVIVGQTPLQYVRPCLLEVSVSFGKPCDLILIPFSFCEGSPLFLRGPPLS